MADLVCGEARQVHSCIRSSSEDLADGSDQNFRCDVNGRFCQTVRKEKLCARPEQLPQGFCGLTSPCLNIGDQFGDAAGILLVRTRRGASSHLAPRNTSECKWRADRARYWS